MPPFFSYYKMILQPPKTLADLAETPQSKTAVSRFLVRLSKSPRLKK
jgi:hypothetical protein